MRLFRKKPEPEEAPEEAPKTRTRKKPAPKPWGKKERLLILILFGGTTFISGVLALSARSWKLPGLPRFALPHVSLEQTYVFENPSAVGDNSSDQLIQEFHALTNSLTGVYGLYVIRLNSGFVYGVNENKTFTAASLIKLPVIATLYLQAEERGIDLASRYTLNEADKIPGAGSLYYQPPGTVVTYSELAHLMANQSDNTAFGIARKVLGDDLINQTITQLGLRHTSLAKNQTTPEDIGLFFQKLYQGNLLNPDHQEALIQSLTDTAYEDYLPQAIPDVQVAHKYGAEIHVIHDAGIVFADSPFVLVLMTEGIIDSEAQEYLPRLAKLIYQFEASN